MTEDHAGGSDDPKPGALGLTREFLMSGDFPAVLARSLPDLVLTTEEQRAASLRAVLADRPEHGGGAWVFAYGSLIWNPLIHISERRPVRAMGWHRDFCLSVKAGRGTQENPGIMLGLKAGGTCVGVALRIDEDVLDHELTLLWRREMVAEGYIPRWVELADLDGNTFGAGIAFTINPAGPAYCELEETEIVRRIATARGRLGSSADYFNHTRDGLRAIGIADERLDEIYLQVTAELRSKP